MKYGVSYFDTGHPWVVYWILHSLDLLGENEFILSMEN
jgi:hypothetical protein